MLSSQKGSGSIVAIIIIILVIAGIFYFNSKPKSEKMMEEGESMMKDGEKMMEEGESMMKDGEKMMEEGESMMKDDQAMMSDGYNGEVLAGDSVPFLDFNEGDYKKALAEGRDIVLYFYATWCPNCKAELADATLPAFNQLDRENMVAFRVNYNDSDTDKSEKDLAREFGVAYQHTKVFLRGGERILKNGETWSTERYIEEINKAFN